MARALIVDEFLGNHSDWRHLALEDIQNDGDTEMEDDVLGLQESFMTMVACECAKEEQAKGNHIIITCPSSDMIGGIYDEIHEPIISVYLGPKEESDGFDHTIDSTSASMIDISKTLDRIIQIQPA